MSNIFYENIEEKTKENKSYRKVVYTGKLQFVYMSIKPLDTIHKEIHKDHDQFIRIEKGQGRATINGRIYNLYDGIGFIIPAGFQHEILNTSHNEELKLYTIYSPPEHKDGLEQVDNPDNKIVDKINNNLEGLKINIKGESVDKKNNYYVKYLKYKEKYIRLKNSSI